jgi:thioredoxin
MVLGMITKCPSCGQSNNIPELASGQKAVCARCKAPLNGAPVTLTDADFTKSIADGRWVVDFWAGWCGPCVMMSPVVNELAATRSDVRVGKLNVDENSRTASQYRAMSIPLFVFFRDGREVARVVGAVGKGGLEAAIAQYLG